MTRPPHLREHDPWIDRLSEYVDGELPRHERDALESHVTDCPRCAVTLAALRAVVARAQSLEDLPPAEDLWPGIAARIAPAAGRRRAPVPLAFPAWWQRRLDVSLPQLAAAAVVLAALAAGAMWLAMSRSPLRAPLDAAAPPVASREPEARERTPDSTPAVAEAPTADPGPVAAQRSPTSVVPAPASTGASVAALATGSPRFDRAIAELEQALAAGRGRLDPRTLRILEENLRTIDRAIAEAQRAVAADPANTWLRSHLASTMQRKVELLRTATMLAAQSG
jgi:hypothetical protein